MRTARYSLRTFILCIVLALGVCAIELNYLRLQGVEHLLHSIRNEYFQTTIRPPKHRLGATKAVGTQSPDEPKGIRANQLGSTVQDDVIYSTHTESPKKHSSMQTEAISKRLSPKQSNASVLAMTGTPNFTPPKNKTTTETGSVDTDTQPTSDSEARGVPFNAQPPKKPNAISEVGVIDLDSQLPKKSDNKTEAGVIDAGTQLPKKYDNNTEAGVIDVGTQPPQKYDNDTEAGVLDVGTQPPKKYDKNVDTEVVRVDTELPEKSYINTQNELSDKINTPRSFSYKHLHSGIPENNKTQSSLYQSNNTLSDPESKHNASTLAGEFRPQLSMEYNVTSGKEQVVGNDATVLDEDGSKGMNSFPKYVRCTTGVGDVFTRDSNIIHYEPCDKCDSWFRMNTRVVNAAIESGRCPDLNNCLNGISFIEPERCFIVDTMNYRYVKEEEKQNDNRNYCTDTETFVSKPVKVSRKGLPIGEPACHLYEEISPRSLIKKFGGGRNIAIIGSSHERNLFEALVALIRGQNAMIDRHGSIPTKTRFMEVRRFTFSEHSDHHEMALVEDEVEKLFNQPTCETCVSITFVWGHKTHYLTRAMQFVTRKKFDVVAFGNCGCYRGGFSDAQCDIVKLYTMRNDKLRLVMFPFWRKGLGTQATQERSLHGRELSFSDFNICKTRLDSLSSAHVVKSTIFGYQPLFSMLRSSDIGGTEIVRESHHATCVVRPSYGARAQDSQALKKFFSGTSLEDGCDFLLHKISGRLFFTILGENLRDRT